MLTVSMPTFNTPNKLLVRAVNSVLNQTYKDLVLIVVNDGGEEVDLNIDDDRLIIFNLDNNYGRYFADAVTLDACQTEFFTIHDSDDWSELNRYEYMFNKGGAKPVIASSVIMPDGTVRHPFLPKKIVGLEHLWFLNSVYETTLLRGLIHPGFRVGYDSLLADILGFNGEVSLLKKPLYNIEARGESLTRSPETGHGSQFRENQIKSLRALLRKVKSLSSNDKFISATREIIAQDTSPKLKDDLKRNSNVLKEMLIG